MINSIHNMATMVIQSHPATQVRVQETRDVARQAAVQVEAMNHAQKMVDTYIQASQSAQSDTSSATSSTTTYTSPADVYKGVMEYGRQIAVSDAIGQVSGQVSNGERMSIMA